MSIESDKEWLATQNAMEDALPSPELTVLVSEINMLTRQTVQNFLAIGQRLTQIKAIIGHGNFKDYVRTQCGYSYELAKRFMRLAAEYSPDTAPLSLGATKMYELLALPAAEREDFLQTHDVESTTVRELRAEIAKVKAAGEEALAKERKEAIERERELREANVNLKLEKKAAKQAAASQESYAARQQAEANAYRMALAEARDENKDLKAQLEAASRSEADMTAHVEAAVDRRERELFLQYESRLAEAQSRQMQAEGELEQLRAQMAEDNQPPSAVSMSGIAMMISTMVNTLNGLRDVLAEGAWNSSGAVEQEWLELAHLELSKASGVLHSAEDAIVRNYPEDGANDE